MDGIWLLHNLPLLTRCRSVVRHSHDGRVACWWGDVVGVVSSCQKRLVYLIRNDSARAHHKWMLYNSQSAWCFNFPCLPSFSSATWNRFSLPLQSRMSTGMAKKDIRTTFSSSSVENALFASVIMNVRHFGFGGASHTLIPQFTASPLKKSSFSHPRFQHSSNILFPPRELLTRADGKARKGKLTFLLAHWRKSSLSFFSAAQWNILSAFRFKSFQLFLTSITTWPETTKGTSLPLAQKRSRRVHKVNWWTSRSVYSRSLPLPPC